MSWDEEFADRYDPEDTRNDIDIQPRQLFSRSRSAGTIR
jgi:hypothetical protein